MRNWGKGLIVAGSIGILALPAAVITGGYFLEKSPSFCNSCHEMRASYNGWLSSGAAKDHPDCISCHRGEGLSGLLESEFRGMRMIGKHFFGKQTSDWPIQAKMPEYFCLKCHSENKIVDSHAMFRIEKQTCADCHKHREGWKFLGQFGRQ